MISVFLSVLSTFFPPKVFFSWKM